WSVTSTRLARLSPRTTRVVSSSRTTQLGHQRSSRISSRGTTVRGRRFANRLKYCIGLVSFVSSSEHGSGWPRRAPAARPRARAVVRPRAHGPAAPFPFQCRKVPVAKQQNGRPTAVGGCAGVELLSREGLARR